MYVHSFYRAGPVIGSAISGIDQALWDIRGKVLGMPVYKLLGGPHRCSAACAATITSNASTREELAKLRETAIAAGRLLLQIRHSGLLRMDRDPRQDRARGQVHADCCARDSGPDIDIAIDFHAKTSPSVASILVKEVEPLNLLFIEEPCPPENVEAMAKIARRSTTPIATGERLIASYGCRELIEMGVVDILQTDINHVGGITALWKVGGDGRRLRNLHGAACLRRPDRRPGDDCTSTPPCRTSWFRRSAAGWSRARKTRSGRSGSGSPPCAW